MLTCDNNVAILIIFKKRKTFHLHIKQPIFVSSKSAGKIRSSYLAVFPFSSSSVSNSTSFSSSVLMEGKQCLHVHYRHLLGKMCTTST